MTDAPQLDLGAPAEPPRAGARPCSVCGAPSAPFGLGLPGRRSDKPEGRRGYRWHCGAPDCRDQLEAEWRAVLERENRIAGEAPPAEPFALTP